MVDIKFCGLMRGEDAAVAAGLGAAYVGVVFAGGPRRLDEASARAVFGGVPPGVARVGVFGLESPAAIAARGVALGLTAIQLHADPLPAAITKLRAVWPGEIWATVRVAGAELPPGAEELFAVADAVLLDAKVASGLGGTGVALPWGELARQLEGVRPAGRRLVLAGGLRPDNVATAIRALDPDVVDVSSGVESSVGIKDPARMRAFRDAVRSVEVER
ncbi:MAG: phosphoribosylanthranilate isomerase [Gemmatimonadaceae bacterium]